jgi:cellulose synthase operon protein C
MKAGTHQPAEPQPEGSSRAEPDLAPAETTGESPDARAGEQRPGRSRGIAVWVIAIAGALLILGFAPLSRLAADGLPQPPGRFPPIVTRSQHSHPTALHAVPAGLPNGAQIRTAADVFPYAVAALGQRQARALMALVQSRKYLANSLTGYGTANSSNPYGAEYPYQYPPLNAVLSQAPPASFAAGATALGAALTVLAAQPPSGSATPTIADMAISNAGPAAYGVLNLARATGRCAPQLDLLLLLTADGSTNAHILGPEERRTEAACPGDPTPAWLVGQSQLRQLQFAPSPTQAFPYMLTALRAARGTFSQLAARYPDDPGVLTGLGDSYLRAGTYLRSSEPFTARQDFQSAITAYDRAAALGGTRDATPGLARALVGLGEPGAAARLLAPLARTSRTPGPLLELLIGADETAHQFGPAVAAAQRLGQLGAAAYPAGDAMIPVPEAISVDWLDGVSFALSFGAGQLTPLNVQLVLPGGAGGSVQDLSFIPQYRDVAGVTGSQPSCASWSWARDELLLGHAAAALAAWPAQFQSARPANGYCFTSDELKLIAEVAAGRTPDPALLRKNTLTSDDVADGWQNLLRWAGKLRAAKTFATHWQAARGDNSALPALRLGEIDFLMHDYQDAAAEFGLAARRWRLVSYNDDLDVAQAQLDQGAALFAAGRNAQAVQTLRPLDLLGVQGYAYNNSSTVQNADGALAFAAISFYACEQLADYESRTGDLHAAAEDYTNALDWLPRVSAQDGILPQALNNNAALAYLGLGDTKTAASLERRALAGDPEDPVFLMTAGFIADRAGRVTVAARDDRAALHSDPGAFPAANDLGVELARQHQDGAAAAALRQAVGASPGYALGWFNLGVVESELGPAHLAAAQGAFAVAYSLDPALRNRQPELTIDAKVYRTALDLSKPLPPRWSLAQLPQPVPAAAAGLLALVLLGLGLARVSGHGGSVLAAQWLDPLADRLRSAPLLRKLHHPGWAVAVTVASFLVAYLRRSTSPADVAGYCAGVAVLVLLAVAARVLLARSRGVPIHHESWPPGLVFGLITGAAGLPWAPLPVVRVAGKDSRRVHAAAPVTLAVLSALLFVESAWLHTPLTGSWAVAALIMSASVLLPVGPLDGARLGKAGVLTATGVLGGAVLVGLGLI